MSTTTIEIDFDVHKCIENERRSFEETPNTALRRLLKLPAVPVVLKRPVSKQQAWSDGGVTLPHGTAVRMEYSGVKYEGVISNGKWLVRGRLFDTPSGAASAIAETKAGKPTRLNGWTYWRFQKPGTETWPFLISLRKPGMKAPMLS